MHWYNDCNLCCFQGDRYGWPSWIWKNCLGKETCWREPWEVQHPQHQHHLGEDDGVYFLHFCPVFLNFCLIFLSNLFFWTCRLAAWRGKTKTQQSSQPFLSVLPCSWASLLKLQPAKRETIYWIRRMSLHRPREGRCVCLLAFNAKL